jgi:hypothetical protein
MVFSNNLLLGAVSATTAAYLLEQSALFDGAAYLSRTPSVAGNRKTWTFSCWIKPSQFASNTCLLSAFTDNNNRSSLRFQPNQLEVLTVSGASTVQQVIPNAVFADASAWYHICVATDTTQATAADRTKVFINGAQITSFATQTNPAQNADTYLNHTNITSIGRLEYSTPQNYFSGLMALPILVDGAALDYTSFAEFDNEDYLNPIAYVTGDEPAAIGATWRGSYSSDTDAASYTKSGAAIGTADANRYVIVAIPLFTGATNLTISSVTIGGVSATKINGETFYAATSGNRSLVDFWKANVPTGTTGDIVITPSTTAPRMSASWWTCIGDVAIIDTQADIATDVTPDNSLTVTSKRPSNGFVLAAIVGTGSAGDPTFTWGGTGITENYETGWGDFDATHSSASGDFTAASTEAITVTNGTGDMYYHILSAVTFAPPGGDGAYGTNGGAYDFADSSWFGKDASVVDASATVISASGEWTVGTASITFSGDGWTYNATDDALYVTDTFAVASWPMSYQLALNGSVDNGGAAIGLFDNAEIGTFNHQNNSGGLAAMTASWRFRPSDGELWYGATTVATLGARSINDILKFIVDADGTVRFFINEVLRHTFAQSATGKTLRLMSACSNTTSYDGCKWVTNIPGNSFTDSGFVAADQLADTPTDDADLGIGNYNTIDPNIPTSFTLSEANTKLVSVGAAYKAIGGTIAIEDTMRVYWEMTIDAIGDNGDTISGIVQLPYADWANGRLGGGGGNAGSQAWAVTNGTTTAYKIHLNSVSAIAGTSALANTNILMFAYDGPAGKLYAGVNGTFYSSADIGAGTGFIYDGITGPVLPAFGTYSASVGATFNFGAKGFTYTPPTGFVALATQNLPAASYATPLTGSFTGNASANGPMVYLGAAPDTSGTSTINGNTITWGTHARATANGFKIITSSASYNTSGANTYSIDVLTVTEGGAFQGGTGSTTQGRAR